MHRWAPARTARTLTLFICAMGAFGGCRRTDESGLSYLSDPTAGAGGPPMMGPSPAPPPAAPSPPPSPSPPPAAMPPPAEPPGLTPDAPMPYDVRALLERRCASCHDYGKDDPAGWGSVLDVSRLVAADIVVPGDPDASRMINRVSVLADMPPTGDRLTAEEVAELRAFIQGLRPRRQPLSDGDVLDAISGDQIALRSKAADYRYLSLTHFLTEGRPPEELAAARAALVFIVNSLSRRANLVELPAIDGQGAILRLRLSELGWDEKVWDTLTSFYPYCVRSNAAAHEALYGQLRTEVPVVRGDWLIATATRSPLYELLLDLPATLDQLAQRLGLDISRDINHPGQAEPDNLLRVGLTRSKVALNNRLVERHLGGQGQYLWLTYDFASGIGRSDLLANPLGPRARDQQAFEHTFEHAGSEAIFTLPNGLQGYMVVDAAGNRLPFAPDTLGRDANRKSGLVETGVSCFGCHGSGGVLRPTDTDEVGRFVAMRSSGFLARELDEIEASYPRVLRPDVFKLDAARYRASVGSLSGGGSPAGDTPYAAFLTLVGQYESEVGLQAAAAELAEPYETFRDRLTQKAFIAEDLPADLTEELPTRDQFVCAFREAARQLHPATPFCAKTFDAAAVAALCPAP